MEVCPGRSPSFNTFLCGALSTRWRGSSWATAVLTFPVQLQTLGVPNDYHQIHCLRSRSGRMRLFRNPRGPTMIQQTDTANPGGVLACRLAIAHHDAWRAQ
ncbi:hypothetical protein M433DRAFT_143904 [Acidomyces richmondensis BFW]|nr:hypothetical protein M433DRAFT_143904 [Acidomyces richmondensis BFW]